MYSDLTVTELRALLTDRNIAGRSKANTKAKAIALLEESDRFLQNQTQGEDSTPPQTCTDSAVQPAGVASVEKTQTFSEKSDGVKSTAPASRFLSFGWTMPQLVSGQKSVTRRKWADCTIALWQKAWDAGNHLHKAYNKLPCYGGTQVGTIQLTERPYLEKLADMPESDCAAEGFPTLTKAEFIEKFFDGNAEQVVTVVRFVFVPFSELPQSEKFRDERSLSSAPAGNETPSHGTLAINSSVLGSTLKSIPAFRLDILQIERLLGQMLSDRINRPRGEDVAFVNNPKALASGVDRAIASYLMRAKFDFVGRLNLTAKYSLLDIEVKTIVSSPIIDTIYGWEIHTGGIIYGKPGAPWKLIFQPGWIFGEMQSPLVADIYELACSKLSAKLSRQFFGPMPISDVSTLRGNHHPDWLCTSDGYWHCRRTDECVQIFRWWWSHANGGQWKLDYCKVLPELPKYRCLCGAETCKHLGIIDKFQLFRRQQERQKQFAEIEKQRQIEFAAISQERRELVQFLREKHFKLASDIGFALFRQPFWGLSLNQLKQIHEEINQVKKP